MDIVERLRTFASLDSNIATPDPAFDLYRESADEIERLRAERDDWKQCAETSKAFCDVEIERLRATLEQLKYNLDARLNDYLCEMKPDYDDSIVGFNEAWDVMRKMFAEKMGRKMG